jgi:hypothetical protein
VAGEPEADRPDLLRGLLDVELEVRRLYGERPGLDELLARLPDDQDLARRVLAAVSARTGETVERHSPVWEVERVAG